MKYRWGSGSQRFWAFSLGIQTLGKLVVFSSAGARARGGQSDGRSEHEGASSVP